MSPPAQSTNNSSSATADDARSVDLVYDYDEAQQQVPTSRKRRSAGGRILMRWAPDKDQHVLLAVEYICTLHGVPLDWDTVAKVVAPTLSGEAIKQHLFKLRKAREEYGQAVPPALDRPRARAGDAPVAPPPPRRGRKRNNATTTAAEPEPAPAPAPAPAPDHGDGTPPRRPGGTSVNKSGSLLYHRKPTEAVPTLGGAEPSVPVKTESSGSDHDTPLPIPAPRKRAKPNPPHGLRNVPRVPPPPLPRLDPHLPVPVAYHHPRPRPLPDLHMPPIDFSEPIPDHFAPLGVPAAAMPMLAGEVEFVGADFGGSWPLAPAEPEDWAAGAGGGGGAPDQPEDWAAGGFLGGGAGDDGMEMLGEEWSLFPGLPAVSDRLTGFE